MQHISEGLKELDDWVKNVPKDTDFDTTSPYFHKLYCIRNYYNFYEEKILKFNTEHPTLHFDSYAFDWQKVFTPIEESAWFSIRCKGRLPLYPQYPALNFIIDFANPLLKIGLELDGKNYHDKEKDTKRDQLLKEAGWTIYRITGSEMIKSHSIDWNEWAQMSLDDFENGVYDWLMHTGDGVIEAIKVVHFGGSVYAPNESMRDYFERMCHKSLSKHKLIH